MAAFLKSFFKPKWQHSSAHVRLQAIDQGLDNNTLETLAKNDDDSNVRSAAVAKITDLTTLTSLFATKSIKSDAVSQYLLVALGSSDINDQTAKVSSITDPNILMTIASEANDSQLVEKALSTVKEEAVLFDYILNSGSAKARQLAIQSIEDLEKLRAIEKAYRNKDKTLVRIAKNKIQSAAEQTAKTQKELDNTKLLTSQAQALAKQAFGPEYVAKLTYLKQQWESALHKSDYIQSFEDAISSCEITAQENAKAQQALEEQQAKTEQANERYTSILSTIKALFSEAKSRNNLKVEEIGSQVKAFQQNWIETQSIQKPEKSTQQEFDEFIKPLINLESSLIALDAIKTPNFKQADNLQQLTKDARWIEKSLKSVNWPTEFASPALLLNLSEQLNLITSKIDSLKKSEKGSINQVEKDLAKLEQTIEEGNLKGANKLAAQIKKLFSQVEAKKVQSQSQRFQLLQKQLHDLQDWKGFAAQPKFQSLIEEMKALENSDLDPKELANRIHDLQEEWKSLGSLGDKKQQNSLWHEFKAAADVAYAPCRAHYNDQSKVRQFNKEQRELICSELESLFEQQDWSNANFKALQKIIDKAHTEYKKFAPVDRDVNKDLQQRFNSAQGQLKEKLRTYYQSNGDEKRSLIEQCQSLADKEDLTAAIDQCKKLQQDWKLIENAGRAENDLWSEFRQACDAVFARRTAQNQAKRAETDQNIADAEKLLAEAKSLADQGNSSDLSKIDELKQQVDQIDMPPKVKSAIIKQVYNAKDALSKTVEQQKENAEIQKWENALILSDRLSELEISNGDKTEATNWISEADLPKGCKDIFQERLAASQTSTEALNELCLEMEISLGLESPATDKDKRMAYQVQLLQQNMGKPNLPRHQQIQALQKQWFALVAQDNGYAEFRQRFADGIAKAQGKSLASA